MALEDTISFDTDWRRLAGELVEWCAAMNAFLYDRDNCPGGFDPREWETAASSVEALSPELEQRGFTGMPTTCPKVDPIGFFHDWGSYLKKISPRVWNGNYLDVELCLAPMVGKH